MIGINSNINSLVAQQNLNGTQSALSSAITRLSSGKRINSAADDAAGQAIASRMTSQINGLNQGVSNSNDAVSMTQTASSGLTQISDNLQRIRQLAVQSATGSLSSTDQAALQKEVAQRIAEVNRIASQTTYNGSNVLDGTAGKVSFQIGANVGQSISVDFSQGVSAASLGSGSASKGSVLGTVSGLSLKSDGTAAASGTTPAITSLNILADGKGGYTFTDQNNQAIDKTASDALFTVTSSVAGAPSTITAKAGGALAPSSQFAALSTANTANTPSAPAQSGTVIGTVSNLNIDAATGKDATSSTTSFITSVTAKADGAGGVTFFDQDGKSLGDGIAAGSVAKSFLTVNAGATTTPTTFSLTSAANVSANTAVDAASKLNAAPSLADIDISSTGGANAAILSIDNALNTVNSLQANLGAAQNRFTSIASTQTQQSTNLSSAQSQITDANFAQETANLSKAQVLQQAGISVLAQANSMPQQVLKLLG